MSEHLHRTEPADGASSAPLRALVAAFGLLAVVLLALPVVMLLDRDFVHASILREQPTLDREALSTAVRAVQAFTWLAHLATVALGAWFVWKVLRGRSWARIALTALMLLATVGSVDSAMAGPRYYGWVIASDLLQVAILLLLWVPRSVRELVAGDRCAPEAGREN